MFLTRFQLFKVSLRLTGRLVEPFDDVVRQVFFVDLVFRDYPASY